MEPAGRARTLRDEEMCVERQRVVDLVLDNVQNTCMYANGLQVFRIRNRKRKRNKTIGEIDNRGWKAIL